MMSRGGGGGAGGGDEEMKESSAGEETALLPASVTGGKTFEVGDQIVLKVVSVDDDGGLEVAYASGDGGGDGRPGYEKAIDELEG